DHSGEIERAVFLKLLEDEQFSVVEAVQQITAQTYTAAASQNTDALGLHTYHVACYILDFATEVVRHDQQSRLLEFIRLLKQQVMPDPKQGGMLRVDNYKVWSDMPSMMILIREFYHKSAPYEENNTPEHDYEYENVMAFLAQMTENGLFKPVEGISWSMPSLIDVFHPDAAPILRRAEIRCVCMWMVYAPNQVRKSALLPYRYDEERGFEPGDWEKWRALLQKYLDIFLDEDTQNLIHTALYSMEIADQVTL
ncbi:unnamed protein product, partial [Clonostachys byssicola]